VNVDPASGFYYINPPEAGDIDPLGFTPCPKWHANEDGEGGSTPARELLSPPGCPGCGARI
jgi:hypothetical protein